MLHGAAAAATFSFVTAFVMVSMALRSRSTFGRMPSGCNHEPADGSTRKVVLSKSHFVSSGAYVLDVALSKPGPCAHS